MPANLDQGMTVLISAAGILLPSGGANDVKTPMKFSRLQAPILFEG